MIMKTETRTLYSKLSLRIFLEHASMAIIVDIKEILLYQMV